MPATDSVGSNSQEVMSKQPNKLEVMLFKDYTRNCKRRNVFFGLAINEFIALIHSACAYCDKPPAQYAPDYYSYGFYTGVDRVNPKWGYTLSNVAPCCTDCNQMKSNRLTPQETRVVGQALRKFRESKKRGSGSPRQRAVRRHRNPRQVRARLVRSR